MNVIDWLFRIAKNVSDTPDDDINKLKKKALESIEDASSDHKGWKGLYAKMHKGWLLQLLLMLSLPFVIGWLNKKLNQVYNPVPTPQEFEDEDEDY